PRIHSRSIPIADGTMKHTSRARLLPLLACVLLAGGLAAQQEVVQEPEQELEEGSGELPELDLDLPVSIKALMVSLIDPAAHYLWDISTRGDPQEDAQWEAVAHVATQLAAAGPLIRLGGTGEDDPAWSSD